ncbi:MAG: hypothetical protein KatS3mg115_0823 [Candidatus Poribacteria bacterium]|nr:MAG: hypothetical protein KatS3mg115_0823 [Candidatus Poribacteria bacterium]
MEIVGPIPLLTTTRRVGVNPGDTFIGVGLQCLFEGVLGPQRWVLVDRFGPEGFREHRELIQHAPFLVYGGMPQYNNFDRWRFWYDDALWRRYVLPWGLRVFTMAGGAGSRGPVGVEEWVADCLSSRRTRELIRLRVGPSLAITVRDPYAHRLLEALEVPHECLPCSATWAARMWGIEPAERRERVLLVPSAPRYARTRHSRNPFRRKRGTAEFSQRWGELYRALRAEGFPVKVLCHQEAEYWALRGIVPDQDLWFQGDAYTLLREYAFADVVVSARLHGSLPAFGIPGTRVVNLSVDVRGSAVGFFPKIQNLSWSEANPQRVLEAIQQAEPSSEEDLRPYEDAYHRVIREGIKRLEAEGPPSGQRTRTPKDR